MFKQKYRRLLFILTVLLLVKCSTGSTNQSVYSPDKPSPGSELKITLDPNDTAMAKEEAVSVIIYSIKNGTINAEEYKMIKGNSLSWNYKYKIPDSSQCLGLRFSAANSSFGETSNAKVYTVKLYNIDGDVLAGGKAAEAYMMLNLASGYPKSASKLAYQLFKDEFAENNSFMKYYLYQYCYLVKSEEPQNANLIITQVLSGIIEEKDFLNEPVLTSIMRVYKELLKDENNAKYWHDYIVEKFPKGELKRGDARDLFFNENNPKKAELLLNDFKDNFIDVEAYGYEGYYPRMAISLVDKYLKAGQIKKAKECFKNLDINGNYEKWMWLHGDLAQITELTLTNFNDLPFTKKLNDVSLKLAQTFRDSKKPEPNWLTSRQYNEMTDEFASYNYLVAGKVYEKTKGSAEALKIVEEGYKLSSFRSDLKEYYTKLLVENDRAEEALKIIDKIIENGRSSEIMLATHKSAYSKINGSDKGYDEYLAKRKDNFITQYLEKVKTSLINEPAPAFTLKDLEGKEVSLTDYKGKIVILDFWATWCAPCKASFPSMKKAVEKYSGNPNVVFLFMNTMERTGKPGENASKYIKAMEYPFHVLIDTDSKAAGLYEVSGIPNKIFIDKNGSIRYKSIGFEGEEILLKEIDTIIELTK